ncbi:hypothetical protein BJAS_P3713 [Bathymodiolus japonicus methanotrophic gill symbiont]|nr:hypothetical protein [Bathymodiolus japonicus methanotrophic gill symbiont]GFO73106.1 hypothetical protein BJAS_P3713 [Bathymodiolus japonicus methanotrophic gill symbiont]
MEEIAQKEITSTCLLLMTDDIEFIEGCRKLVFLRNQYDLAEDLTFSPIVGIVSETDDFPDKNARENFSKDYLERIDKEVMDYILEVRPSIIDACSILIEKYVSVAKKQNNPITGSM